VKKSTRLRSYVVAVHAVVGALALGACSAPATGAQQADKGTLRVVASNEPTTLNPIYGSVSDAKSWGALFDALVGDDPTTNEANQNGLLYGWERPTPTKWTFKVRPNVTFHNGEAFDAAAAAFTIAQEYTDKKANLGAFYSVVENAAPVGDILEVTTKTPYPALPDLLASTMAVAPKAYQTAGADGFAAHPVGTGPFAFSSYQRGGTLKLTANEKYWQGAPKLNGLNVSWSGDAQTRASLAQTGQADLALDLTPQTLGTLNSDTKLNVVQKPIDARYFVYFNTTKPPFDNPIIRKAAALAIDKKTVVGSLFKQGGATPYNYFVGDLFSTPPTYDDAITYDPEKAKNLLASVPGSHEITMTYANGRSPNDGQIGAAIVGMWENVGFKVKNDPVDFSTFLQRRGTNVMEATGAQIVNTFRDPDEEFRAWVGRSSIVHNCASAPYDVLSEQALAAPSREAREKVYGQMEDRLLNQDVCYVPILKYDGIWAMSKKVGGFTPPRLGTPAYARLTLAG
jgi:peptide/nickel transport system substrate-binding protein